MLSITRLGNFVSVLKILILRISELIYILMVILFFLIEKVVVISLNKSTFNLQLFINDISS